MSERKISECINVRINVGNFQHIELSKYAEESIQYENENERIEKEDALRDDLIHSLARSMKAIPEKLGKGISNAVEVEEAIVKAIPEWLEKGAVPNIANLPKKKNIQDTATQKDKKDKEAKNEASMIKGVDIDVDESESKLEFTASGGDTTNNTGGDLFDDDLFDESENENSKKINSDEKAKETESSQEKPEESEEKSKQLDGFFDDDDDLFDD